MIIVYILLYILVWLLAAIISTAAGTALYIHHRGFWPSQEQTKDSINMWTAIMMFWPIAAPIALFVAVCSVLIYGVTHVLTLCAYKVKEKLVKFE